MTESPGREIQAEQAFQVQQRGASAWRSLSGLKWAIPELLSRGLDKGKQQGIAPCGLRGAGGLSQLVQRLGQQSQNTQALPSVIWARGAFCHLWLHVSPMALGSGEQHLGWGSGHCQ